MMRLIFMLCVLLLVACSGKPRSPVAATNVPVPVFRGIDPSQIPTTDEVRIQIVPLVHVDARKLMPDLIPLMGDAVQFEKTEQRLEQGENVLVFRGPAVRIHRLVSILQTVDVAPAPAATAELQMVNSNASDAARLINAMFTPSAVGRRDTTVARTVYAESDTRTNSVILKGQQSAINQALDMLKKIDALDPR